jgi:cell division protein FtsB
MTLKQKIFFSLATMVILSTSLLIVFGENGLNDYNRMSIRHQQLIRDNEAITLQNARLYRQIDRLKNDPEFIESIARQELGMIGHREIIIKPITPIEDKRSAEPLAATGNRISHP